jgi:hypothetical protein
MNVPVLNQSIKLALDKNPITKTQWTDTPFEELHHLSNDERGAWGESLLHMLAKDAGFKSKWLGDKNINQDDGTYDNLFEGKRIEVKTSFRGSKKVVWQHENISIDADMYDYLFIIDIDPKAIYFTVLSYEDIHKDVTSQWNEGKGVYCGKVQPFNLTPTFRKNEKNKFKMNFSRKSFEYGMSAAVTFIWDWTQVDNPFIEELTEMTDILSW